MEKFNFKNRIQSNPRLLRLKNPITGQIIDYEIQDLQESEIVENGTEMTAEVLNNMQDNIESDLNTKANKTDIIKTATYIENLTYVSTTTNVEFATMFPNLSLSQIICFNVEITNVNDTWNGVFANIIPNGQLQVRSYNQTQEVTVKVTAFYK